MKPDNLKTRIFLDSGNPEETREILELLGFLDGQTTNPSLIAKNPEAQKRLELGDKFSAEEVNDFYKDVIEKIETIIPEGSLSIEVYADKDTLVEDILTQARQMNTWSDNAYIKLPIIQSGLEAAEVLTKEGVRVNMTLCFSQQQAAAVYSATAGARADSVYLSPFVGRLDDKGINGMSLIKNIHNLYKNSDKHVSILSASIRSLDHLLASIAYGADIVTVPGKILRQWAEAGMPVPDESYKYSAELEDIEYEDLDIQSDWKNFNIQHNLTDAGLQKFADDWNSLVK